jgi:hypothetical protein
MPASKPRVQILPNSNSVERRRPNRTQPVSGDTAGLASTQTKAMPVAREQEFLLCPIDSGEDPACLACGKPMMLAGQESREAKPAFMSFRCLQCGRSERFICEQ